MTNTTTGAVVTRTEGDKKRGAKKGRYRTNFKKWGKGQELEEIAVPEVK